MLLVVVMVLVGRKGCGLWQEGAVAISAVFGGDGVARGRVAWQAAVGGLRKWWAARRLRGRVLVVMVLAREWRRGWKVVGGALRAAS